MENNQILTDEEIDEGLILTCQAVPTSQSLIIDYDDNTQKEFRADSDMSAESAKVKAIHLTKST